MSPDEREPEPGPHAGPTAAEKAARRRRLAEVFGDVLPEQTNDDAAGPDERPDGVEASEAWLRRQVPPHHGEVG